MPNFPILLVIAAIPFAALYHLNLETENIPWDYEHEGSQISEQMKKSQNIKNITLNQFTVYKRLGHGGFAMVFLVKKNGGTDDGTLYALKAIDIEHAIHFERTDHKETLNNEREILQAVVNFPYTTQLNYGFLMGKWAFLVLDLVSGGPVQAKLFDGAPDASTAQLILAESITLIEELHKTGISHKDLSYQNILINDDGHLVLIDFGFSSRRTDNDSNVDWDRFPAMCRKVFPTNITDEHQISLIHLFENVTDSRLHEVKNHTYFEGIEWQKVAERQSRPPYEAQKIEFDYDETLDLIEELELNSDDELDVTVLKKLRNYAFVAPQHL